MALGSGGLAQAFVRLRVDSSQVAADTSKGIKEGAAAEDRRAVVRGHLAGMALDVAAG